MSQKRRNDLGEYVVGLVCRALAEAEALTDTNPQTTGAPNQVFAELVRPAIVAAAWIELLDLVSEEATTIGAFVSLHAQEKDI